jgi:hypothetical protein
MLLLLLNMLLPLLRLLLLLVLNVLMLLLPDRVAPTVVDQDKLQVLWLVVVGVLLMMMKKKMMLKIKRILLLLLLLLLRPDRVAPSFLRMGRQSYFVPTRNVIGCTLHFLAM